MGLSHWGGFAVSICLLTVGSVGVAQDSEATLPEAITIAAPDVGAAPSVDEASPSELLQDSIAGTSSCPAPIAERVPNAERVTAPKLTTLVIRIEGTLGSKISQSGQVFPIVLALPLVIDGAEIIPAGTAGVGEVIHAKKAGGSGSAGELILAASYLELNGRKIGLRSMRIGIAGASNIDLATAVGITLGPVGFLVSGKNTQIEAGTLAEAKLAEDFSVTVAGQVDLAVEPCLEGSL